MDPGDRHRKPANPADDREAARTSLRAETGNFDQPEAIEAFLDAGPRMLDWFKAETAVKFAPTLYPDYHPIMLGGVDMGRSVLAAPYDSSALAADLGRLRPPLATSTCMGMMFNSWSADTRHFFDATRSARSVAYVMRRLAAQAAEVARHGRGVQVTSGNALAARLAKTCLDLGIPILTDTPALRLVQQDARVTGVYAHLRAGGQHHAPVPLGNTGDGIRLGEAVGGALDAGFPQPAA